MKRAGKVTCGKDKDGDWRWRAVSSNGRIIAESGEGYKTRQGMMKGLRAAFGCLAAALEAFDKDE
jgi:uncharacterized protein YegP (UPF0339 family)